MEELLPIALGGLVMWIVQMAKRKGINPSYFLMGVSFVLAAIYAAAQGLGWGAYLKEAFVTLVEIAGTASLVYNYIKQYNPQVSSNK
jgi:hypothetical protein